MTDASQPIIDKALAKIAGLEVEIAKTKLFINQVCEFDGRDPLFPDVDGPIASSASAPQPIAPDAYFGKPLATAVRLILEDRAKRRGGVTSPMTVDEIHDQLTRGGFSFSSKDTANQRTGLQVSLAKNTTVFRRLPNGMWGLVDWYGAGGLASRTRRRQPEAPEGGDDTAPSLDSANNKEDWE